MDFEPVPPTPALPLQGGGRSRSARLAEHLRRAAAAVPQGVCVREIAGVPVERLAEAAAAMGVEVAAPSRSHLAMPGLEPGQRALLAPGSERGGSRLIALCYDRRALDDWGADRLLADIAAHAAV